MASELLQRRIQFLTATQNADGGWGYFPGRKSWLEPTAWAMLALGVRTETARAWSLIRSWQRSDGSCRAGADVDKPSWATSLWVTLHCTRDAYDEKTDRAVNWLASERGAEGHWLRRSLRSLRGQRDGFNAEWCGWAWWPGTSSWLEPTAHALVALRNAAARGHGGTRAASRIAEGEQMLLDRRCADGGWNYGVREALDKALPSYPETTAIALLALAGAPDASVKEVAARTGSLRAAARSAVARAWLALAMRVWRQPVDERPEVESGPDRSGDVLLAALEALGADGGNWRWLSPGVRP